MARTIYRYEVLIEGVVWLEMPLGAQIISVSTSRRDAMRIELWAIVDPKAEIVKRRLFIYGTGHEMLDGTRNYIGTIQTFDGRLVFHIFEG